MNPRKLLIIAAMLLTACGGNTVYFGTYSGEVISAKFKNGTFGPLTTVQTIENPSYLALDGNDLYAVSETDSAPALFHIGSSSAPTLSAGPCHVTVANGYAAVSNYSGGALTIFKLPLNTPLSLIPGTIGGPDSIRQCVPHIHCAVFTPDGSHVLASDFSADRIISVSLNTLTIDSAYPLSADTGPRHMLFGSDSILYIIGELSGKITVMEYPGGRILQEIDADPVHSRASADIRLSPDKRYLYASNRLGMDGVAVFNILSDGTLHPLSYTKTAACPRNIAVSPDGKYLLVASQTENLVEVYPLDSGLPGPRISTLTISKPVCILFSN